MKNKGSFPFQIIYALLSQIRICHETRFFTQKLRSRIFLANSLSNSQFLQQLVCPPPRAGQSKARLLPFKRKQVPVQPDFHVSSKSSKSAPSPFSLLCWPPFLRSIAEKITMNWIFAFCIVQFAFHFEMRRHCTGTSSGRLY